MTGGGAAVDTGTSAGTIEIEGMIEIGGTIEIAGNGGRRSGRTRPKADACAEKRDVQRKTPLFQRLVECCASRLLIKTATLGLSSCLRMDRMEQKVTAQEVAATTPACRSAGSEIAASLGPRCSVTRWRAC